MASFFDSHSGPRHSDGKPRGATPSPRSDSQPISISRWSFQEFRRGIGQSLQRLNSGVANLPDHIEASPFQPVFRDLLNRQSSHEGEIARVGYIGGEENTLVMDKRVFQGDRREVNVTYSSFLPWNGKLLRPAIMFHTHPQSRDSAEHHFSGQDFHSFLTSGYVKASVVICDKAALMMVKTTATDLSMAEKEVARRIREVSQEVLAAGATARNAKLFTRLCCLHFGLKLYLIPTATCEVAKRVQLI